MNRTPSLILSKFLFFSLILFAVPGPAPLVAQSSLPSTNRVAIEFPTDGGGLLILSRMWRINRYLEAGISVGGGTVDRDFELEVSGGNKWNSNTDSLILPFIGPRLTAHYHVIGISLGWGVFYAETDFEVDAGSQGKAKGRTKGWGTGFYSPLLVLDFYNSKYDMAFGVGLGGLFGTSFKDLTASNNLVKVTSDESPIDTLTFHVSTVWASRRWKEAQKKADPWE